MISFPLLSTTTNNTLSLITPETITTRSIISTSSLSTIALTRNAKTQIIHNKNKIIFYQLEPIYMYIPISETKIDEIADEKKDVKICNMHITATICNQRTKKIIKTYEYNIELFMFFNHKKEQDS